MKSCGCLVLDVDNRHHYETLMLIFNTCFEETYQTRLEKGGDEPLYLPRAPGRTHHAILFAHGFFSSALHECAHWLLAGAARRLQMDYGYWYEPDGRSAAQQAIFERVEIKPQALEWILSVATGYRFRLSVDNVGQVATESFRIAVCEQAKRYCAGLPKRANRFMTALSNHYDQHDVLNPDRYHLDALS